MHEPLHPPDLLRDEAGFTIVELLVGMILTVIVLFAILQSFDGFSSNAAHQTKLTDANDQVRRTMDRTVADLRGASVIVRAAATDLVYQVAEPAGVRTERICVSASDLYMSTSVTAVAPSPPTAACSSLARLVTLRSTASTGFTYDGASSSATPATVKNVGLTFSLDARTGARLGSSTLQASAARRASSGLPLTDSDLEATCNAGGALLSLNAGLPALFGPLTVRYTTSAGVSLGTPSGTILQIPEGITSVVATVTDAAGVSVTIGKGVECS